MKRQYTKASSHSQKSQHGGTLIGILIGVVIGLGIAVVTALVATKTSLPFIGPSAKTAERTVAGSTAATSATTVTPPSPKPQVPVATGDVPDPNRGAAARQRAAPGQPAVERNEIPTVTVTGPATSAGISPASATPANMPPQAAAPPPAAPNAPVSAATRPTVIAGTPSGTASALPPGGSGASGPAPIRAAVPSTPSSSTGSALPAGTSGTGAGASSLGSGSAQGVPAPQASAAGSTADRGASYLLQAGAFRGQDDADAMKLRLALMGLEAQIVTAEVGGTTLFRVRVGPYAGLDAMTRARTRLAENGVEATVLRLR